MARPTYLVAVSGQSIYIGYSPTQMTQATNGADVLVDTPVMDMEAGPGSINDTGDQRYHRHMYFCDGSNYVKLDAHTAEVFDWTAYRGVDAATEVSITGALPYSALRTDEIVDVTGASNIIHVGGDQTDDYSSGDEVIIENSEGNDGLYTVDSATYDAGDDQTDITLNEDIDDIDPEGIISIVLNRCTMMVAFRDRCVMAGLPDQPQNWFMSAAGDWRNWDYSQTTATSAVAGNASDVGEVGDAITALIPFSDDTLIFGCESSIYRMTGDPADGGYIDNISQSLGIAGQDAWAIDPHNTLYFFGNDGLYRMAATGAPEPMSAGRLDKTFASVDLTDERVILEWDRERKGLYIFFARAEDETQPRHWFWDQRTDSFWPMRLPDGNGPQSVTVFDTDAAEDRTVLLGGMDGYIRNFRDTRPADNNGVDGEGSSIEAAIDSYVDVGPVAPAGAMGQMRLTDLVWLLGENSGDVSLEIRAGTTPEQAQRVTDPAFTRTLMRGRNTAARQRLRGNAFVLRLAQDSSTTTWAMENGEITLTPAGRQRKV